MVDCVSWIATHLKEVNSDIESLKATEPAFESIIHPPLTPRANKLKTRRKSGIARPRSKASVESLPAPIKKQHEEMILDAETQRRLARNVQQEREKEERNIAIARLGDISKPSVHRLVRYIQLSPARREVFDAGITRLQAAGRGWFARKWYAEATKRLGKRSRVVFELLETEKRFIKSLETMLAEHRAPLAAVLPDDALDAIVPFADVHSILDVARSIMFTMEGALANGYGLLTTFGAELGTVVEGMKRYSSWVNKFDTMIAAFNETREKYKGMDAVLAASRAPLDLPSYLIMPVQRAPRIELLLRDIIKQTPTTHPDHGPLGEVYTTVQGVAMAINESKRDEERREAILGVEAGMKGRPAVLQLDQRHRTLLGSTPARRSKLQLGRQSAVVGHLFNDVLVIADRKGRDVEFQAAIPIRDVVLTDLARFGQDESVGVACGVEYGVTLTFDSPEQKATWVETVKAAVATAHEEHPRWPATCFIQGFSRNSTELRTPVADPMHLADLPAVGGTVYHTPVEFSPREMATPAIGQIQPVDEE